MGFGVLCPAGIPERGGSSGDSVKLVCLASCPKCEQPGKGIPGQEQERLPAGFGNEGRDQLSGDFIEKRRRPFSKVGLSFVR